MARYLLLWHFNTQIMASFYLRCTRLLSFTFILLLTANVSFGQVVYVDAQQSDMQIALAVAGFEELPSFNDKLGDDKVYFLVASDYFRSRTTGDWNNIATWESSANNLTWSAADLVPTSAANSISIERRHTVTINTSVSLDQTVVNGTLVFATGGILNITNGIN